VLTDGKGLSRGGSSCSAASEGPGSHQLSTGGVSSLLASGGLAHCYSSSSYAEDNTGCSTATAGSEVVECNHVNVNIPLKESEAKAGTVSAGAETCGSLGAAHGSSKRMQQLLLAALLPMGAVAVAAVCGTLGHTHIRYKRAGRGAAAVAAPTAGPMASSSSGKEERKQTSPNT
jgi:hypothetical protein